MSSRYAPEPPTSGKVILNTTYGPIHAELWTKEAPLACRNFIQLCLEGYYDNQAFYRIVPGFLVQTGDPEETGDGGECIYGPAFADEFHSRLKFAHRGILAMATTRKNANKSAFFFTLDATPWLNAQHTIFGKVPDDTMFNLLRIGECEVDKHDRPLVLPRILSTEVLVNPFDDVVPREKLQTQPKTVPIQRPAAPAQAPHLLSFDDDLEPRVLAKKPPLQSEALQTPSLLPTTEEDVEIKTKKRVLADKEAVRSAQLPEMDLGKYKIVQEKDKIKVQTRKPPEEEFEELKSQLFLELKKRPRGSNNPQVHQEIRDEETFLSPLELRRYKYYQNSVKTKGREHQTLGKLNDFVSKLRQKDQESWYTNRLKFSVDSARAYSYKTESMTKLAQLDEAVVVDATKGLRKHNEKHDPYSQEQLDSLVNMEELYELTKQPEH